MYPSPPMIKTDGFSAMVESCFRPLGAARRPSCGAVGGEGRMKRGEGGGGSSARGGVQSSRRSVWFLVHSSAAGVVFVCVPVPDRQSKHEPRCLPGSTRGVLLGSWRIRADVWRGGGGQQSGAAERLEISNRRRGEAGREYISGENWLPDKCSSASEEREGG